MRNVKEWHTCDRCGEEVSKNKLKMFSKNICRIGSDYVDRNNQYRMKYFDLCPKCRKDFERFMKNEKLQPNHLPLQQR